MAVLPNDEVSQHDTNGDTGRVATFSKKVPLGDGCSLTSVLPAPEFRAYIKGLLEERYENLPRPTDVRHIERPVGELVALAYLED